MRDARAQVLDFILECELLLLVQLSLAFTFTFALALGLRVVAQLPQIRWTRRRRLLLRWLLLQTYKYITKRQMCPATSRGEQCSQGAL